MLSNSICAALHTAAPFNCGMRSARQEAEIVLFTLVEQTLEAASILPSQARAPAVYAVRLS